MPIFAFWICFAAWANPNTSLSTDRPGSPVAVVDRGASRTAQVAPSGKAKVYPMLQGRNAFVAQLELAPGASVPEHRDATEEYLVVISGGGKLTIDGQVHQIGATDAVFMPAGALVSYENGPDTLVAFQVFAGPKPSKKYATWKEMQ